MLTDSPVRATTCTMAGRAHLATDLLATSPSRISLGPNVYSLDASCRAYPRSTNVRIMR